MDSLPIPDKFHSAAAKQRCRVLRFSMPSHKEPPDHQHLKDRPNKTERNKTVVGIIEIHEEGICKIGVQQQPEINFTSAESVANFAVDQRVEQPHGCQIDQHTDVAEIIIRGAECRVDIADGRTVRGGPEFLEEKITEFRLVEPGADALVQIVKRLLPPNRGGTIWPIRTSPSDT